MGQAQTKDYKYNVPVGEKPKGASHTYRNYYAQKELELNPRDDIFNMQQALIHSVEQFADLPLLGSRDKKTKEYKYRTYKESFKLAQQIGSALKDKKLITHIEDQGIKMNAVGIFSKNREEWLITEYGNFLYNFTLCPIYDTLGPEAISYVLNETEITTLIISEDSMKVFLKCKDTAQIKNIVAMDDFSSDIKDQIKQKGWELYSFWGLIDEYKNKVDTKYPEVKSDDIFTFSYTSGTTGNPKGCLISHRNILSVCIQTTYLENPVVKHDTYLSYLPLPHVLERFVVCAILYQGGKIAFFGGDVQKLKDDLADVKPTIFVSVPRLYTKFYGAIKQKLEQAPGIKGKLAMTGLKKKMDNFDADASVTHMFWDTLVFNKTRDVLGGRVKLAASGGAPISDEVTKFLNVTLCVPIQEGYGATETTGFTFHTSIHDKDSNSVGAVTRSNEFKLEDITEMGYSSEDKDSQGNPTPRGEICVRGHSIARGYFKQPEKTEEVFDKDGWYHTGDVGQILPNGGLKIIDRKKNLFKLAQGEYIAPEKIENIYTTNNYVEEAWVHGDSLKSVLVGVMVPNQKNIEEWAKQNNVSYSDYGELLKKDETKKFVLDEITKLGKQQGLYGFEQPKKIHLEEKSFQDLGITTNTFKIKRKDAREHYEDQIKEMYKQIGE